MTAVAAAGFLTVFPQTAHAQVAPGTLGWLILDVGNSLGTIPNILAVIAYISGLFLAVWAILGFKEHVDTVGSGRELPISTPLKRLLAGGLFLALPYTIEAAIGTVTNTATATALTNTARHAIPAGPPSLDMILAVTMQNIGQVVVSRKLN